MDGLANCTSKVRFGRQRSSLDDNERAMILAAHIIGKVLGGVIGKVLLDRKA